MTPASADTRFQAARLLQVSTVAITLKSFLAPFARHFRNKGMWVAGMAAGATASLDLAEEYDALIEAKWSRNPLDPRGMRFALAEISRVVSEGNYNIVHVHTPVAAFLVRIALRRLRRSRRLKVIYTAHGFHFHPGGPIYKNCIFSTLERISGRWTDFLVVLNRDDEVSARKLGIVPPERIIYMPGIGVPVDEMAEASRNSGASLQNLRDQLGMPPTAPYILMVAEFNPGKRHRDLLRAFSQLKRRDVHLLFAGAGRCEEEMRHMARELGIADRVHFLGFRLDVPTLLSGASLCVLPSEREGLPRSIMEAMSIGCPVLGTDIRGIRDLLCDDCGYLVPVGDVTRLSVAVDSVLAESDEALRRAENARSRIRLFDLSQVLSAHEELYTRALQDGM